MTSTASDSSSPTQPPSLGNIYNTSGSAWTAPQNGIVGGYMGGNVIIIRAMTAFTAIACVASRLIPPQNLVMKAS